jgi:hypothetical protein
MDINKLNHKKCEELFNLFLNYVIGKIYQHLNEIQV